MTNNYRFDLSDSIKGKIAFVSGGFRGIGRECVNAITANGGRVAFTYSEGHESKEEADKLVAENPECLSAHALDLTSISSMKNALQEAKDYWGEINILVNNAAVGSATVKNFADTAEEQDTLLLGINADGTLKMCQIYLELMSDYSGTDPLKVINLSSVGGGITVFPGFRLSDGMSKAAVAFLTRQLAAENVSTLIDVFAVCPGATNTKMFQASTLDTKSEEEKKALLDKLPKQRLIEPKEIADIVLFLASGYSSVLHGAIIDASMGLGVRPGLQTEL